MIGDSWFYHETANLVALGHGYSSSSRSGARAARRRPRLHPPLYPLALALLSRFGGTSELAHRLLGVGFALRRSP